MDDILSAVAWVAGILISSGLGATAIGFLVQKLKETSLVKKLHLEALIDGAAKVAVQYVEQWAKTSAKKGTEKLNVARDAFQKELARHGVKLDMGSMDKRLESVLLELQGMLDLDTALDSEGDN